MVQPPLQLLLGRLRGALHVIDFGRGHLERFQGLEAWSTWHLDCLRMHDQRMSGWELEAQGRWANGRSLDSLHALGLEGAHVCV